MSEVVDISGGSCKGHGHGCGCGTGDLHYKHDQTTADTVWTIMHSLGKQGSIQTFDTTGRQIYGCMQQISDNESIVTFSTPISGYATVN
jgi:hypothetical protein